MEEIQNELYEELIIAGFGGQGIMLIGKLLAQTAMKCGTEVTYMPSYGAEVRGGTANCMLVISDSEIACPVVGNPTSMIIMNKASLTKFAPRLGNNGLLILNSSLINIEPDVDDSIEIIRLPADDIAIELGSIKAANMVALGAYLQAKGFFNIESVIQALPEILAQRYHKTLPLNNEALRRGASFVSQQVCK